MHRFILAIAVLFFTANASAVNDCSKSFSSVVERHTDALDARDLETFIATIAPRKEQMMILPDGSYWETLVEIRNGHEEWFKDESWVFNKTLIRKDERPTWGILVYRVQVDRPKKPGSPFLLSMLFAPEDDGCWYLQHDQNTLLPADKTDK